ncbi:hypothetical protein OESDEN_05829 [Oesophagostomum dentatum]|uniref:Uncharacterized protein n=1 Tax=Oesophagostomum dentatum TaxID=61180 RepID=A0A0B1TAH8_OESDE|nr:hypothetical protein OESDEN_05829 [Oesophagostomum dentatum]
MPPGRDLCAETGMNKPFVEKMRAMYVFAAVLVILMMMRMTPSGTFGVDYTQARNFRSKPFKVCSEVFKTYFA